ncbi:MAG: response regulator [Bacteroidetes bacterium]|nr:response regulator [Bacteroidota bacterium]MBU1580361.1 response regulator [Bacteroidota bacterium]MBU2556196.1 response regulator [Bacteroidota bacterium]
MKKILVIEDDRLMRENISELLDLVGYEVESAHNGKEGVKKARTFLPDLIICDIKMPVLDGYGVLHILQKEPITSTIPFIFLTAKTERSDRRKGMEMGADDYLAKPFEDTELLKAVETRFRKHRIFSKKDENDTARLNQTTHEVDIAMNLKNTFSDCKVHQYDPKENIFKTGEYPHYLFFIESGSAKTFRLNIEGKELISNIYRAGDFFGYQPVFEDRPYNETAIALEPSQLLNIPKNDFLSLIYNSSDIASNLIKIISKNLSDKEEEMMHMAYDSVRKRVAFKLLELIPANEQESVAISRTDLASLVGTTNETLVRTLTELKDLKIIKTDSHEITLINREKLKTIVKNW